MKLIKTLPALFALVLLAGCASQQADDTTGGEATQKEGSCCKAEGAKSEGAKASCCDGAKVEKVTPADEKPAQKN
jgi:hypothetical protein